MNPILSYFLFTAFTEISEVKYNFDMNDDESVETLV